MTAEMRTAEPPDAREAYEARLVKRGRWADRLTAVGAVLGIGASLAIPATGIEALPLLATYVAALSGVREWLRGDHARFLQSVAATRDMSDDLRTPVLLLRSYSRSRLAGTPRYGRSTEIADFVAADPDAVLREVCSMVQWCIGPVVTVEEPHRYRAGRYGQLPALNETWRTVVLLSARVARCVVVVPDHSAGIEEEIRWALRGSRRVVVVMPPGPERRLVFSSRWEDVRQRWARQGFKLPDYDVLGAVYVADGDLSPRTLVGLNGRLANMEKALPQMLVEADESVTTSTIAALAGELAFTPQRFPSALTGRERQSLTKCLTALADDDVTGLQRESRILRRVMSATPGLEWWAATLDAELALRSSAREQARPQAN